MIGVKEHHYKPGDSQLKDIYHRVLAPLNPELSDSCKKINKKEIATLITQRLILAKLRTLA